MPDAAVSCPNTSATCRPGRHWILITALVCALLTVLLHYPGQMSVDTVLQLYDGRTGNYQSNQPPVVSFLLARLTPAGFLLFQVALYTAAVLLLVEQSRATVSWRIAAVVLLFLYPLPLTYNGILWKDVLYANLVLLGFMTLAVAGHRPRSWLLLSGAVLGLACLVRQQGAVAAVLAVPAVLTLCPPRRGWRIRLHDLALWTGTCIAVPALMSLLVSATALQQGDLSFRGGLYQIMTFDLAGISARVPDAEFPRLTQAGVDPEALQRKFSQYGPDRVDRLAVTEGPELLYEVGNDVLFQAWLEALAAHPLAYLRHRLDVFTWLLGLHDVKQCLPLHVGIVGEPADKAQALGLEPNISSRAKMIAKVGYNIASIYKPLPYVLLGLMAMLVLWHCGRRRYASLLWLQGSGLFYLATYLVVGIACDVRYAYFPMVAALFCFTLMLLDSGLSQNSENKAH